MRSLLLLVLAVVTSFSAVTSTPVVLPFSGSVLTTSGGVSVSALTGSNCAVENQDITKLGVNCVVKLQFQTGAFTTTSTLTGGINLIPTATGLSPQLNYGLTIDNPLAKLQIIPIPGVATLPPAYTIPSSSSGLITIPVNFPTDISTQQPFSICLSNVTSYVPNAGKSDTLASITSILQSLHSDACITASFAYAGKKGAKVNLHATAKLLDMTLPGVTALPIVYDFNIGAKINELGVTITNGKRFRALLDTASYIYNDGSFLLGQQTDDTSPASSSSTTNVNASNGGGSSSGGVSTTISIVLGSLAGVVVIVAAVIIIRKKRTTHV